MHRVAREPSPSRSAPAAGFTLVELLIALAVLSVLSAVALPAFGDLIHGSHRATVANELLASLMAARGEAIARGQNVAVCPGTAQAAACASGRDWSAGWLMFVDVDADGQLDAGETLLRRHPNPHRDIRVAASGFSVSPMSGVAVLRPFSQSSSNGTLVVCDPRGARHARAVILAPTGRPRGSDRDAAGSALSCA